MAQVNDPKKSFQFNILVAGLNTYEAQKVNLPDWELDVVEHGDVNHDIKTAGKVKFGDLVVEKLRPVTSGYPNWVWDWILSIQNASLGGGLNPSAYKRTVIITQLGYDGFTVTDIWECSGVFPKKINGMEFNRGGTSENSIETIDFSVDKVIKRR